MKLNKYIAILLALLLAMNGLTIAHAEDRLPAVSVPQFASAVPQSAAWLDRLDPQALKQDLFNQLYECREKIDIAKYRIPVNDLADFLAYIQFELPEAFHLSFEEAYYLPNGGLVDSLYFNYLFTKNDYHKKLTEVRTAAKAMIADLKDLPPLQQALLLHDRIALSCSYQEEPFLPNDFTLYGALIEKTAVCQGYALSYQYMLEMLGIESEICSSYSLNHAWNIVTIDGRQYHVDITWDDAPGLPGQVRHENFLRSTAGIISSGHIATDFNTAPTDTTYDSYFWQDCEAAFVKLRDDIYYIDPATASIRRYSDGASLLTLGTRWPAFGGYYPGCFSMLACDGTYLLYSQYDSILRFDPVAGTTQKIYTPVQNGIPPLNIYAFELDGSTLNCILSSSPNFQTGVDMIRTVSADYEIPLPFTTGDAVTVMQYLIDLEVPIDWGIMDRNLDDTITIADAVLILRALSS